MTTKAMIAATYKRMPSKVRAFMAVILALAFGSCLQLSGQSCTTAVCNAATPNRSDVLAALPSSSTTQSVVTVNIPSGTATWSSELSYTVPSAVTNLTIQGATSVNCTGTAGQSSYACSATDSTTITDGYTPNGQNQLIQITTGSSSTNFRWTGTTFKTAANTAKNNAMLVIQGNSHNVRLDHNHFMENGQNNSMVQVQGDTQGVADHNLADLGGNSNVGNWFRNFASSDGVGDAAWNSATPWGTLSMWYLESDVINGGSPTDCYNGAVLAVRYSTLNNIFVAALHGTKNDAGRGRSCRATEFYHNYMSGSSNANAVIGQNGGTSMLWGNNIASGYNHFNAPGAPRNISGADSGSSPWDGGCGPVNGGPSYYDGNQTNGYPCLDGVGRGQGNLLSGTPATPHAWPAQFLEPEYMFMNTEAAADAGYINDITSQVNRDIYADCNGKTFAGVTCSSFTGAQGTGFGIAASRPSTCTAGPGGTYDTSPTGSYGVAYWATDANSGNGELYVCTATNTWTPVYQPAVYPHPLVTGGTNYTWALTVVGSGTVTGTNSSSGTYASGTTIGPLTATPAAGNTFSGWSSVTGSASCSGNPTSSFALTANSGCTATFTGITYTLTVSTTGTGTGTVSGTNCTTGTYASGTTVTCTPSPSAGSSFLGWSGACSGTGSCSFNLNANSTVTATFGLTAAQPTFSPAGGSFASTQTVTISSTTVGATIYYTTDGSVPDHTSSVYSAPITVSTSQTVNAIAAKTGYGDSPPGTAVFVINGTLSPPTFSPPGGAYGPAQTITLSAPGGQAAVIAATMTETSNATASTGAAVHRNTYTNCATGYSGGVLQPSGYPVGNLYCTSSDKTTAVANGGPNNGVVVSNITGTGTTALDNGHDAGGTDSAPSVTATYGGTASGGCPVGTNVASTVVSGLTLLGAVSNANAVFGATSASSGYNTSMLTVSKYNISADAGNYYYREDCQKPNTTSVNGEHFEWDTNYASTDGSYFGWGIHYNFSDSKFYYCPQGCSSWKAMTLTPVGGGTALTTYSWPANNSLYSQFYLHRTLSCSYSSVSNCAFYDMLCLRLYDAAGSPVNSLTCYNLKDATSGQTPSFIPQNKTSWTHPQFGPQHQIDINGASANVTNTVAFDNLGAYSLTIGTSHICYTTDGTDPTGDTTGACTHGTLYSAPFTVSVTTTVKAITVQSAFNPSAVSSETYTINGTAATPTFSPAAGPYTTPQSVTISDATAGSTIYYTTDGTTPTTSSTVYAGAIPVSVTTTVQAIATAPGYLQSAVGSALYTISIPAPTGLQGIISLKFSAGDSIQ